MSKKIVALFTMYALCLGLFMSTAFLAGCTPSQVKQVEGDINVVLDQAASVLVVLDPNSPAVADIQKGIAALKTAEAAWIDGGAVQDVVNALNILEEAAALIPLTAPYAGLIGVLVAGIDIVLNYLAPGSVSALRKTVALNSYHGRAVIAHHRFRSRSYDFKQAWNQTAKDSGLQGALIK